jgi:hypothetical protein
MFPVLHFALFIFFVPFILLICTFRNCRYLPELGYAISDAKLLRLFPTAQNLPKNQLHFYISLGIGPIEYEKRTNNHTIKCLRKMTRGKEKGRSNAPPVTDTLKICVQQNKMQVITALRLSTAELSLAST